MLLSDHPHLFETGGENYHTDFTAWDYTRGHEGDPWRTWADPTWVGAPALPTREGGWYFARRYGLEMTRPYDLSRTWFRDEADFPGPRTMVAAAVLAAGAPRRATTGGCSSSTSSTPTSPSTRRRAGRAATTRTGRGTCIIWPPYDVDPIGQGRLTEREGRQVRANYGSKLSMIDHWFGEVLSALDDLDLWDDTAVVVCTDHGHYLGERDMWGKPGVPQYEPLGHIPLLVHWPGAPGGTTCDALTTTVDVHATLADAFGVEAGPGSHGRSLVPLLTGEAGSVRDWAIGGVFGNWVQVTDGRRKYARGAVGENFPLSMWSNRWSTMPVELLGERVLPPPDERAWLDRMPGSEIPVIRQPYRPGDMLPYWVGSACVDDHHLYDLDDDPAEEHDLVGTAAEDEMVELLRAALDEVQAPDEQLRRLGLAR